MCFHPRGRCATNWAGVVLACVLTACAVERPTAPALHAAEAQSSWMAVSPESRAVRAALAAQHVDVAQWPLPRWNLAALSALALAVHSDMAVARADVASVAAHRRTALQRANPALDVFGEHHSAPGATDTPWTLGLAIDVSLTDTVLGQDRRRAIAAGADARDREALYDAAGVAWQVHRRVRDSRRALFDATADAAATRNELALRREDAALWQTRLAQGAADQRTATAARLRLVDAEHAVAAADQRVAAERTHLAAALGVAPEQAAGLVLDMEDLAAADAVPTGTPGVVGGSGLSGKSAMSGESGESRKSPMSGESGESGESRKSTMSSESRKSAMSSESSGSAMSSESSGSAMSSESSESSGSSGSSGSGEFDPSGRRGTPAATEQRALQRAALQNRLDVRAALAGYAAAAAQLRVEVARQWPELRIRPGYEWDQGDNRWQLGFGVVLPTWDRNAGPIGEARATLAALAARFTALQAQAIGALASAEAAAGAARLAAAAAESTRLAAERHVAATARRLSAGDADRADTLSARLVLASAVRSAQAARSDERAARDGLEDVLQRPLDGSDGPAAVVLGAAASNGVDGISDGTSDRTQGRDREKAASGATRGSGVAPMGLTVAGRRAP